MQEKCGQIHSADQCACAQALCAVLQMQELAWDELLTLLPATALMALRGTCKQTRDLLDEWPASYWRRGAAGTGLTPRCFKLASSLQALLELLTS